MALVITAPEALPKQENMVFLAGTIDMGAAKNWQRQVISSLAHRDNIILLNPRRAEFRPEMEDEQIKWELEALEAAQYILMWFPKEADAPVSLLELGLYLKSGKLFLGVEDGFYRQRNIELTAQRYNVEVHHDLDELVEALLQVIHIN